jgi:tetratricopeptide (TPR) repeat protein
MLGIIHWFYDYEGKAAEVDFKKAVQSNPNSLEAHHLYATMLCATNRLKDGLAQNDQAIALDPLNGYISSNREYCYSLARRTDEAIAQHKKTFELDPNYFYQDSWVGIAYRQKKMFAEAVAEYKRVQQITGTPKSGLAVTYIRMGKTEEARKILQELLELSKQKYTSPEHIAKIYANLGEKDKAFEWLEKAYEARSAVLPTEYLSDAYDPIRSDPRFVNLLKRMNLE